MNGKIQNIVIGSDSDNDAAQRGVKAAFTICRHHSRMRSVRASQSPDAILALLAERAGTALACTFSSADEFEAAIIKARRAAGAYRSRSRLKQVCCGCAVGLLVVLLILAF